MPRQALSEVEMATSHPAGEDEVNTPPEDRMLCRHITIKEEERDENVPEEPIMPQCVARQVHLVDNWNERVNYQCIHNQDLWTQGESLIDNQGVVFEGRGGVMPIDDMRQQFVARTGKPDKDPGDGSGGGESLIDDQGVVFEGRGGVMPIDDMRQQFVARTGKPDKDPGDGSGDDDHHSDCGHGHHNNDRDQQDRRDDRSPPGRPTKQPVPRGPQGPHFERRTEEPAHQAIRAWSLPSPHDLRASTPGMNEAVRIHMDHMHDRLTHLVDDSLGVRFKFPDGVKPHRSDGKHIRAYAGGHKFSQLEDWAMDVCYHLAACCYGGDDMDQERIF
ncbi:hypothetical protein C0993_001110, partial [Termitomyces sp. T159_Od127]